jgi:hypothetical protein
MLVVVSIVNCLRSGGVKHRTFRALLEVVDAEYSDLGYASTSPYRTHRTDWTNRISVRGERSLVRIARIGRKYSVFYV